MNIFNKIYIVKLIYNLQEKYGKHYVFPSQAKLVELLYKIFLITRCRRTINYWLKTLEDEGLVKRVRRIKRGPNGNPVFRSTMYFLQLKGLKQLNKFGFDVWARLEKYYKHLNEKQRQRRSLQDDPQPDRISVEEMRDIWAQKKSKVGT